MSADVFDVCMYSVYVHNFYKSVVCPYVFVCAFVWACVHVFVSVCKYARLCMCVGPYLCVNVVVNEFSADHVW